MPRRPDRARRISPANRCLHPREIVAATTCVDFCALLEKTLPRNRPHFDRYLVVATSEDKATQQVARQAGATVVVSDRC